MIDVIKIEGKELTEAHKDLEVTYVDHSGATICQGKLSHWNERFVFVVFDGQPLPIEPELIRWRAK